MLKIKELNVEENLKNQLQPMDIVKFRNGTLGMIMRNIFDLVVYTKDGKNCKLCFYTDALWCVEKNLISFSHISEFDIVAIKRKFLNGYSYLSRFLDGSLEKELSENEDSIIWDICIETPKLKNGDIVQFNNGKLARVKNEQLISIFDEKYEFALLSDYNAILENTKNEDNNIVAIMKPIHQHHLELRPLNEMLWTYKKNKRTRNWVSELN